MTQWPSLPLNTKPITPPPLKHPQKTTRTNIISSFDLSSHIPTKWLCRTRIHFTTFARLLDETYEITCNTPLDKRPLSCKWYALYIFVYVTRASLPFMGNRRGTGTANRNYIAKCASRCTLGDLGFNIVCIIFFWVRRRRSIWGLSFPLGQAGCLAKVLDVKNWETRWFPLSSGAFWVKTQSRQICIQIFRLAQTVLVGIGVGLAAGDVWWKG